MRVELTWVTRALVGRQMMTVGVDDELFDAYSELTGAGARLTARVVDAVDGSTMVEVAVDASAIDLGQFDLTHVATALDLAEACSSLLAGFDPQRFAAWARTQSMPSPG